MRGGTNCEPKALASPKSASLIRPVESINRFWGFKSLHCNSKFLTYENLLSCKTSNTSTLNSTLIFFLQNKPIFQQFKIFCIVKQIIFQDNFFSFVKQTIIKQLKSICFSKQTIFQQLWIVSFSPVQNSMLVTIGYSFQKLPAIRNDRWTLNNVDLWSPGIGDQYCNVECDIFINFNRKEYMNIFV